MQLALQFGDLKQHEGITSVHYQRWNQYPIIIKILPWKSNIDNSSRSLAFHRQGTPTCFLTLTSLQVYRRSQSYISSIPSTTHFVYIVPKMPEHSSEVNLEPILPILHSMLEKRVHPKTLCPSEVVRALSTAELRECSASCWRDLMPSLRELCFEMREKSELEILQKGEVLPSTQSLEETRGPIRIRKKVSGREDS
jgi:hypothetical protein